MRHAAFEVISPVLVKEKRDSQVLSYPFIVFHLPQKIAWRSQMTGIRGIINGFGRTVFNLKSPKVTSLCPATRFQASVSKLLQISCYRYQARSSLCMAWIISQCPKKILF